MGHAELSAPGATRLAYVSAWLLLVVWVAELGALVSRQSLLAGIATVGLVVFVMLALLRASRHIRLLFVLVTGGAVGIALVVGDPAIILRGFERAQIFGAFLPSVLLLRATVETSPRVAALRRGTTGFSGAEARNWTLYGSHALGAVLNVGALAILAPVVTRGADEAERLALASSAARGVGTAIMWSPFFVAMAFSSQLVPGVDLWQTMLIGVGLAMLGLVLSWSMFTRELGQDQFVNSVRRLGGLVGPTVVMVAAVIGCTVLLHFPGLQAVTLVLPVLCGAYLVTRGQAVAIEVGRKSFASFSRLADEMLIVVGAMVLGVAIGSLPQVHEFAASVTPGMIAGAPLLIVLVTTLVALGQLGLHPMIGVSIVLPVIAAGSFGIDASVLVSAAVFAWGLSASISVWTLPVAVAATTFGVPVSRLWTARSAAFGLVFGVAGLAYLVMLNAWMTGRIL